jgi:hypothetical protein
MGCGVVWCGVVLCCAACRHANIPVLHARMHSVATRAEFGLTGIHPKTRELMCLAMQEFVKNVSARLIDISRARMDDRKELLRGKAALRMVSWPKRELDALERAERELKIARDREESDRRLEAARAAEETAKRNKQREWDQADGQCSAVQPHCTRCPVSLSCVCLFASPRLPAVSQSARVVSIIRFCWRRKSNRL